MFHSLAEAEAAYRLDDRGDEARAHGRMKAAFRLTLRAANAGVTPAFAMVAHCYDRGLGTKMDKDLALRWFRRAYLSGHRSAADNIGCILRDRGKVGPALKWLKRSLAPGRDEANLIIAKIYLRDTRTWGKAIPYLRKARKSRFVTEGGRKEAGRLLKKVQSTKP